jgi:hypothetical protein
MTVFLQHDKSGYHWSIELLRARQKLRHMEEVRIDFDRRILQEE